MGDDVLIVTTEKFVDKGYHVQERFFGERKAQARGRAQFVADENGRPIDVLYVNETGIPQIVDVVYPKLENMSVCA